MASNYQKTLSPWQHAIEIGICPYGHPLERCHSLVWRGRSQKFEHRCKIHHGGGPRKGRNSRKNSWITSLSKPGPVINHENQATNAFITFVCGHTTLYTRRAIEVNEISYPGDLWCERCVEWTKVHSASNIRKDQPSWVYHEKEVAE